MKRIGPLVVPVIALLSSCLNNPDENYNKIDDGEYKVKIRVEYPTKGMDTTVYGYIKLKKGYVTELDSESKKPFNLGVYKPSKLNPYEATTTIKTLDGRTYSMIIMDNDGEPMGSF